MVVRPAAAALLEAQRAFWGAAVEAGLATEDDVNELIEEVRAKRGSRHAS